MSGALDILAGTAFWTAALTAAAPMLLAALGALLCGRSGVLQLGSEGLFIAGALAAFLCSTGSPLVGLLAAAAIGASIGLIHGVLVSPLALPQRTTGLALTLLVAGLAQLVLLLTFPAGSASVQIVPFVPIGLPPVPDLPGFGQAAHLLRRIEIALQVPSPVYAAAVLVVLTAYLLNRTPLGLAVTACGENPDSIATQGRSAHGLRVGVDAAGSALFAIGGGVLILTGAGASSSGQIFSFGPVNGRGFLALALALAARWRPGLTLIAALLFGIVDTFQQRLQQSIGAPTGALLALAPVVLVIAALAATSANARRVRVGR